MKLIAGTLANVRQPSQVERSAVHAHTDTSRRKIVQPASFNQFDNHMTLFYLGLICAAIYYFIEKAERYD